MPEYPIRDTVLTSLTAQEPWPDNVKLFQPYEVEQILLPDNASCLAVQAFLKMCNLPFEVEMRWNAEFMSPSGRVPFIKCGAFVVSELEPIVQFAANKGVSLCGRLSTEEKAEMRAYMSLITNVLVNAELYISWIDNETFNSVTKVRNSSVYPWPLGWLQTRTKRNAVAKRLKALHWHDKTLDQVLADVEQCCNSLSQRLGDKDYFFGTPTPLDALVYGHVRALLSATGPKAAHIIKPITSALLKHVVRVSTLICVLLTPQEEYLLRQAFHVSQRRALNPERTQSERNSRRSKLSLCNQSRDNIYNRDVCGFRPFACKHIMLHTSEEGNITCQYDSTDRISYPNIDEEHYNFLLEIIEDILDKVEETVLDEFTERIDIDKGFEVIAFPNIETESKYESVHTKLNEFLDPIEENDDSVNSSPSIDGGLEDMIQVISDTGDVFDSDGLLNDKLLTAELVVTVVNETGLEETCLSADIDDNDCSTINNIELSEFLAITSCGDQGSVKNMSNRSGTSIRSPFSTESKSTLKMPSDEDVSVECLLNYLRKRNAIYYNNTFPEMADID